MSVVERIKHQLYPCILGGENELYVHCAIASRPEDTPLPTEQELKDLKGRWEIFFDMNEGIEKGLVIGRGAPLSGWATLVDISNSNSTLPGERAFPSAFDAVEWIKESVMIQEMISSYHSRLAAEAEEAAAAEKRALEATSKPPVEPLPVEKPQEELVVVKDPVFVQETGEVLYTKAEVMEIIQFLRPDINPHHPLLAKILL
jgi:hypothetical protein